MKSRRVSSFLLPSRQSSGDSFNLFQSNAVAASFPDIPAVSFIFKIQISLTTTKSLACPRRSARTESRNKKNPRENELQPKKKGSE